MGTVLKSIFRKWTTPASIPSVRRWLARHPRWTFDFTPTSASWLNAVEGFFAKLTKRHLERACSGVTAKVTRGSPQFSPYCTSRRGSSIPGRARVTD
jgi:transposase